MGKLLDEIRTMDGIQFQLNRCKNILSKGPEYTRKVFRAFQNPEYYQDPTTNVLEERDPYLLVKVHAAVLEEHLKVMVKETEQFPSFFEDYTVIPIQDVNVLSKYGIPRKHLNLIFPRLLQLKDDLKKHRLSIYEEVRSGDETPFGEKSSWVEKFIELHQKEREKLISETKIPEYEGENAWVQMYRYARQMFSDIADDNRISHSRYDTKVCWIIDHLSVRLEFLLFKEDEIDEMLSRPQEKQRGYTQELSNTKGLLSSDFNPEEYKNYYEAIDKVIESL